MQNKHLVVLSGAGVSAESGLATFRDSGGLWEGYNVDEVASIDGWYANPAKVLDFYNLRRRQLKDASPNLAHQKIAELETHFSVSVITQNVDNLHEKAGSTKVIHLHGELTKARSVSETGQGVDIGYTDINPGDKAPDGKQLRPAIVWFGEMVPMIEIAAEVVSSADILIVIGTSLAVYPAAGLVYYAKEHIPKFIIDPGVPELMSYNGWTHIKRAATEGIEEVIEELKNYHE